MLAAMSAAPEAPDFCCKKGYSDCGSYAGSGCCFSCCSTGCGYGHGCGFCGKGFLGCGLLCCGKGGCGFCGSGFLGCGLLCCGKGGYGGCGYGYGGGYGGYGAPVIAAGISDAHTRAEVIVRVPANARLFANGQPTDGTGVERIFATPSLTPSQNFKYVMQVEYTIDGQTRKESKEVTVRAGHRTLVDFTERAKIAITVSLPANSKLTVDGIDTRMTGGKHTFHTPELTRGQPFSYQFRAEIERDGQIEVVTQKVSFKAGEPVNVDFTEATRTVSAK
jgi:uncharacterized protein (TIGR03000 family)